MQMCSLLDTARTERPNVTWRRAVENDARERERERERGLPLGTTPPPPADREKCH